MKNRTTAPSPTFTQTVPLGELNRQQYLAMALEAAKQAGWNMVHTAPNGFRATTGAAPDLFDEEITLGIAAPLTGLTATITSTSAQGQTEDTGRNQRNIADFLNAFEQLKTGSSDTDRAFMQAQLEQLVPPGAPDDDTLIRQEEKGKLAGFLAMFIPVEGYFITPILVNLNILIFIIMSLTGVNIISPESQSLLNWGANFRPLTLAGEWWRLLTNCFIHIGVIHLLMNMYALVYIGMLLEPFMGRLRFAVAYVLTGIAASVVSLWWHDLTISAGASGAIFGMYGVFLALLTTNLVEASARKAMLSSIGVFVAYNLVFGLKGGIDNAAHIGGLVSGILVGYSVTPSLKKPALARLRTLTLLIPALLILTCSFIVYKKLPNTAALYDAKVQEFTLLEQQALELYNLPENAPDSVFLNNIKNKGIPAWNACLSIVGELEQADLPEPLQKRVKLIRAYYDLRLKSYQLTYKSIAEQSHQYDAELKSCISQIEAIGKQMEDMQ